MVLSEISNKFVRIMKQKKKKIDDEIALKFIELQKSIRDVLKNNGIIISHIIRILEKEKIMARSTFYEKLKNETFTGREIIQICHIINNL